ncbi:hypothetical protein [Aquimarina aggregata]|uniref:hypothetical protein n=1 Tax=Aquimarina aggregata TaxID=1642818 RepID=UPI0024921626|nr:hypothetical protein [Aquimarina aggregata]
MKKKLEAELISIAHRILQLKGSGTLPQLQEEARQVYEKLTILNFSESYFAGPQPTIGQVRAAIDQSVLEKEVKIENKIQETEEIEISELEPIIKEEPVVETIVEPELKEVEQIIEESNVEHKPELVIEEINARVTEDLFVPAIAKEDKAINNLHSTENRANKDQEDYKTHARSTFETETQDERPKSLNEQLRKDIHIGLNDRLAFIKYLFEGSAPDYNRVLSQLNTLTNKKEAQEFIINMVKPDYNHWENKEEYEERFITTVLSKFDE